MTARRDSIIIRLGRLGCTADIGAMADEQVESHWRHHLFTANGHAWGSGARCHCGCGQSLSDAVPVP